MLINSQITVNAFCPYIKTEETIFELLKRDKDQIPDDFELMPYPLAHWINNIGIQRTNELISTLKSDVRRVFVCQHIFVDKLAFKDDDIVFTPHSSQDDDFITIPHYAVNIDKSLMKEERDFHFSFLGSTTTHKTRKRLVEKYPDNCFDSKVHWGLDHGLPKDFKNFYIKLLGNSTFGVCPRGTGISSVRFFESMAMGAIPIPVADDYEFPLKNKIDWGGMVGILTERQALSSDPCLLNNVNIYMNTLDIKFIRNKVLNIYEEYFSNENLHKTILITLNENLF